MRRPKKTVTINLADYLSAGTYNVKVKSKGTDIRDSAESNSVECVVAASDLTGTKWMLPSNIETQDISVVAGQDFVINFTSVNTNFAQLRFGDFSSRIYKYLSYDNYEVWNYDDEWIASDEAYRLISITGGTDATNATLKSWLEANAIQQEVYNGGGGGADN